MDWITKWEVSMDYNNNGPDLDNNPVNYNNNTAKTNGMATAALVLGILAIVSICCVYGSYILGGIAITLGLLSRGKSHHLSTNAIVGITLSIVGMVISTVIIIFAVVTVFSSYGSMDNFMQQYESIYEEMYGDDFPFPYDFKGNGSNSYDYYDDSQPIQSDLPNTLIITLE